MPRNSIDAFLSHASAGFACYASGDRRQKEGFVAPVVHHGNGPAREAELRRIPNIPGAEAARALYEKHDGVLLFSPARPPAEARLQKEGFELLPLGEWDSCTRETVADWVDSAHDDHEMPYGRHDFIAIAQVRFASQCVHWVVRGPNAGKVYWWPTTMPPAEDDPPLAESFEAFIDIICSDPVYFLNELMGCYLRYEDGKTDKQWIPKRYIPNLKS